MAFITLAGSLQDPNSDMSIGDQIRFTQQSTTGQTLKGAVSVVTISVLGTYSVNLQYGLVLVEYRSVKTPSFRSLGIKTVNADNPATSIPELLIATVPVSSADLIAFQALLADSVAARDAALVAQTGAEAAEATLLATQITTTALIASTATFSSSTVINTTGFTTSGDGGNGGWKQNGETGQTVSRSPAQLGDALLNDALGNQWALVPVAATVLSEIPLATLGGKGDNSTDNLLIFNVALASDSEVIVLGEGVYRTSGEILIGVKQKKIRGAGQKNTEIKTTATTGNIIKFAPAAPSVGNEFLANCGISNLTLGVIDTTFTGVGLYLEQTSGFKFDNVSTLSILRGVVVAGGQLNQFSNFILSAAGSTASTIASSGVMEFIPTLNSDGVTYQNPFTCEISNFSIGGSFLADCAIYITAADGLNFSTFYIGNAKNNSVHFDMNSVDENLIAVNFTNGYFDGVSDTTGTVNGVRASSGGTKAISGINFTNFFLANYTGQGFSLGDDVGSFNISSGTISGIPSWGINATMDTNSILLVSDMDFVNNGTDAGKGHISVNQSRMVKIADSRFDGASGAGSAGIKIVGAHESVSVCNNTIRNCNIDYINTATVSGELMESGNISLVASPTIGGSTFGNKNLTNPLVLDNYEEFDGTPTVSFGGAAVGVTYSSQSIRSTRIGRMVFFNLQVGLSSKGSSTGSLVIDGLPVASLNLSSYSCSVRATPLISGSNDYGLQAVQLINSTTLRIDKGSVSGGVTQLSDVDIQDNTTITISGQYQVAS
jgi:hypothetical protein